MKKKWILFVQLCFLIFAISSCACFARNKELIKINILKVYDGDTVQAQINDGKPFSIRLKGIDCYETSKINRAYKQAYLDHITIEEVVKRGKESKGILQSYVKNSPDNFYVEAVGLDKYNRTLGTLYSGGMNVNNYMLNQGKCMKYIYKGK